MFVFVLNFNNVVNSRGFHCLLQGIFKLIPGEKHLVYVNDKKE